VQDQVSADLLAARARRAVAAAEREELELAELQGRLVDRMTVDRETEAMARHLRNAVLEVPAQVSETCARMSDRLAIEDTIQVALEGALDRLSQERPDAL
jgi:phage terminase Nu1 subunit (DNA packaging protein)